MKTLKNRPVGEDGMILSGFSSRETFAFRALHDAVATEIRRYVTGEVFELLEAFPTPGYRVPGMYQNGGLLVIGELPWITDETTGEALPVGILISLQNEDEFEIEVRECGTGKTRAKTGGISYSQIGQTLRLIYTNQH